MDKNRLMSIEEMYALKWQQKQCHKHHILTKNFKVEDLVLFLTLKEFVSKLTKHRWGTYVIASLSSSIAIKLSTLDGEEMPNWTSGCSVRALP